MSKVTNVTSHTANTDTQYSDGCAGTGCGIREYAKYAKHQDLGSPATLYLYSDMLSCQVVKEINTKFR
jgi:hypothetical protein